MSYAQLTLLQIGYEASNDILDWLSYFLSIVTMLLSVVYASAFYKYVRTKNLMVRYLSCAIVVSCTLFALHTMIWDFGLRTMQLVQNGQFISRSIGDVTRMHYMFFHFFGFTYVAWRFGQFLRLTIPEEDRKDFPWWKAPFYPKKRIFW